MDDFSSTSDIFFMINLHAAKYASFVIITGSNVALHEVLATELSPSVNFKDKKKKSPAQVTQQLQCTPC